MGRILITFIIGYGFGLLFSYLHIPIPWMLGPLAGITLVSPWLEGRIVWPVELRNTGLVLLGYMMGRPFTPEAGQQILDQLPIMAAIIVALVLFSLAIGYGTARWSGVNLASCVLGTVPGGLSQMVVLGEEIAGADITVVTFMQTARMLAVVFTVPFLLAHGFAGGPSAAVAQAAQLNPPGLAAWPLFAGVVLLATLLAVKIKLPTPYLLGPMLGTALLVVNGVVAPAMPSPYTVGAQLFVGIYMGTQIRLDEMARHRKIIPFTLLNVVAIVIFSLGLGYALAQGIPTSLVTGFLSTAPGGMAEMGLAALVFGGDTTTVVTYHLFRLLFILLIMPLVLKAWLGTAKPAKGPA